MNRKGLRSAIHVSINELPVIRCPWSVDDLCFRLAEQRGRPIVLHAMLIPALPFGLWYDDGRRDHIIHRAGITSYHRDHVILHEVFHMLTCQAPEWRGTAGQDAVKDSVRWLIERATMSQHADESEMAAELFATKVLGLVKKVCSGKATATEQRAAALFGSG